MAEEEIPTSGVAEGRVLEVLPPEGSTVGEKETIYGMYMRHIPVTAIAREFGVKPTHIQQMVKSNGWEKERNQLHKDIKKAVKQAAVARLNSITSNGLFIVDVCIKNTLKMYKTAQRAPSTTEAETILKMVKMAHSMKVYEEGHGSGAADLGALNPEEVVQSFMEDPYMRKIMSQDNIITPPKEISSNAKNDDTFDRSGGERSASQEARALTTGAE